MAQDEQDKSQKTEQPSERKLERVRKEGQIVLSKEVNHWFMICGLILLVIFALPGSLQNLVRFLKYYIEYNSQITINCSDIYVNLKDITLCAGRSLLYPFLVLSCCAICSGAIQTRFMISLAQLKPKLSKLSIMSGLKRIFGTKSIVEFIKNFIKLVVVITITYYVVKPEFKNIDGLLELSVWGIMQDLNRIVLKLLVVIVITTSFIALLDYGYQKYRFIQDQKMTKQEQKEEHKEVEGDMHVKARLRRLREEKYRQRVVQDVPKATVVLTNPTHYAVALKYDGDAMDAPILLVKGADLIAQKIRTIAEEYDIPIVETPDLTRAIYANVETGQQIPEKYFKAVANVIRYVMGYDDYYSVDNGEF